MNKKLPAWTLYLTIGISIFLLCGISGIAATTEPETITKTITKEIEVKDDSQTYEITRLQLQLEQCQKSTLVASQGFVDVTNAFVKASEGMSNFDVHKINEATRDIGAIDSASIGLQARECDPNIASKITGLP